VLVVVLVVIVRRLLVSHLVVAHQRNQRCRFRLVLFTRSPLVLVVLPQRTALLHLFLAQTLRRLPQSVVVVAAVLVLGLR